MEDFAQHPERRVFHLDTECYVIYLGRDADDYKPFLRVGNTSHLSKEIRGLILPIVVTDTYTGSPLLESQNLSDILGDEFRYIGDPDTVERFKRFLRHMEFPSEGFEASSGEEDMQGQGVFVYFYDDGNIRITFDRSEVFNLKRREERDLHYPERARRIKNLLSRTEMRVPLYELDQPGFFVRSGGAYLFSRRSIGAVGLRDEYFSELAQSGIDPDRVTSVITDEVTEGLLRFFKRSRVKNDTVRVLTLDPSAVDPAVDLFRGKEQLKLRAEAVRLHADRYTQLLGFRVQKTAGVVHVEHPDSGTRLQLPTADKPKQERVLSVDPESAELVAVVGGKSRRFPLMDGVPYRLFHQAPSTEEGLERYMPQKLSGLTDMLSSGEDTALQQMNYAIAELAQGREAQTAIKNLKRAISNLEGEPGGVFWAYAANGVALASILRERTAKPEVTRGLGSVEDALRKEVWHRPRVGNTPSLVCDLVVSSDAIYPLYRFTSSLTLDKLQYAGGLVDEIHETETTKQFEHFHEEAERLDTLIGELDTTLARTKTSEREETEESPPGAEQAAASGARGGQEPSAGSQEARSKERTRGGDKSRRERGAQHTSQAAATRAAEAAHTASTSGGGGRGRRGPGSRLKRRRSGRGWLIAAVVLILLGAGVVYLMLGTDVPARMAGTLDDTQAERTSSDADTTGDESEGPEEGADAAADSGDADSVESTEPGEPEASREPEEEETASGSGDEDGSRDEEGGVEEPESADGPGSEAQTGEADESPDEDEGGTTASSPEEADADQQSEAGEEETAAESEATEAERALAEGPLPPGLEERDGAGGLTITILDIIKLANRIAVSNGYRALGDPPEAGPDPDWIYPGNEFDMPDGSTVTVVSGDTLWGITADFIEGTLAARYGRYRELVEDFDEDAATAGETQALIEELQSLQENTYSEEFAALLQKRIRELREE
jgi:LysM repeat protein